MHAAACMYALPGCCLASRVNASQAHSPPAVSPASLSNTSADHATRHAVIKVSSKHAIKGGSSTAAPQESPTLYLPAPRPLPHTHPCPTHTGGYQCTAVTDAAIKEFSVDIAACAQAAIDAGFTEIHLLPHNDIKGRWAMLRVHSCCCDTCSVCMASGSPPAVLHAAGRLQSAELHKGALQRRQGGARNDY
jgi:hypothetical protein